MINLSAYIKILYTNNVRQFMFIFILLTIKSSIEK